MIPKHSADWQKAVGRYMDTLIAEEVGAGFDEDKVLEALEERDEAPYEATMADVPQEMYYKCPKCSHALAMDACCYYNGCQ
jgi:hypothetical protein